MSVVPLWGQRGAALQFVNLLLQKQLGLQQQQQQQQQQQFCSLAAVWHLTPLSRSRFC